MCVREREREGERERERESKRSFLSGAYVTNSVHTIFSIFKRNDFKRKKTFAENIYSFLKRMKL